MTQELKKYRVPVLVMTEVEAVDAIDAEHIAQRGIAQALRERSIRPRLVDVNGVTQLQSHRPLLEFHDRNDRIFTVEATNVETLHAALRTGHIGLSVPGGNQPEEIKEEG